jgi:dihydrofolate reductase
MDMTTDRTWRGRVFIGMSLDGYIARPDSDLGWLTDPPAGIKHEHVSSDRHALDWPAFIGSIDHIVMGRGTYEKALTFDAWPYDAQHVIVLSTTLRPPLRPGAAGVSCVRSVGEAVSLLGERRAREVYVDGGQVIQAFLAAGLIDEISVGIAPVLIGTGIPLFGQMAGDDVQLRLRAAHASETGMTHATYDVVR